MFWWQEKHSEERKCHGPGLGEESMLPPRMTHTPCCVTRGLVTIKRWPCTAFQAQNKTNALKTLLSGHQPRLCSGAQSVQCRKRPPPPRRDSDWYPPWALGVLPPGQRLAQGAFSMLNSGPEFGEECKHLLISSLFTISPKCVPRMADQVRYSLKMECSSDQISWGNTELYHIFLKLKRDV